MNMKLSRKAIDNTDPRQTDQDAQSEVDILKWQSLVGAGRKRVYVGVRGHTYHTSCSLLT